MREHFEVGIRSAYFTEKISMYQDVTAADPNHGGEAQADP